MKREDKMNTVFNNNPCPKNSGNLTAPHNMLNHFHVEENFTNVHP